MLGAAPRGPGEHSRTAPLTGAGIAGLGPPAAGVTVMPPCLPGPVVCRVSIESVYGIALAGVKRGLSQASLLGSRAHPWRWQ